MEKKPKQQGKKPFFARLLETQELEKIRGGVESAPAVDATLKAPSDSDEIVTNP
jgi:hypothetical protein